VQKKGWKKQVQAIEDYEKYKVKYVEDKGITGELTHDQFETLK